jgi:hypothetical protein
MAEHVQLDPPVLHRRIAQLEAALSAAAVAVPPIYPESQTLLEIVKFGKLADEQAKRDKHPAWNTLRRFNSPGGTEFSYSQDQYRGIYLFVNRLSEGVEIQITSSDRVRIGRRVNNPPGVAGRRSVPETMTETIRPGIFEEVFATTLYGLLATGVSANAVALRTLVRKYDRDGGRIWSAHRRDALLLMGIEHATQSPQGSAAYYGPLKRYTDEAY